MSVGLTEDEFQELCQEYEDRIEVLDDALWQISITKGITKTVRDICNRERDRADEMKELT